MSDERFFEQKREVDELVVKANNRKAFEREAEIESGSVLRRNRYSTVPPYVWYGPDPEPERRIERSDKYHIVINGLTVIANEDQEQRIRTLTPEQLQSFRRIMGGF
jgi:hypothetical protein